MNVSVAQTVEADAACDTTITATITAVVGAPAAEIPEPATDTVTTTAADGSGSAVFGVRPSSTTTRKTGLAKRKLIIWLKLRTPAKPTKPLTSPWMKLRPRLRFHLSVHRYAERDIGERGSGRIRNRHGYR